MAAVERTLPRMAGLMVALCLAGCEDPETAPASEQVKSIEIYSSSGQVLTSLEVSPSDTLTLTARARFAGGGTQEVTADATWLSSDADVVSVRGPGQFQVAADARAYDEETLTVHLTAAWGQQTSAPVPVTVSSP